MPRSITGLFPADPLGSLLLVAMPPHAPLACVEVHCHVVSAHRQVWWAGGAFSLASSTAGKEHHGMEGAGDVVLECIGEAGPSRTLAPRYPAKARSCSLHSFPLPISHSSAKGCCPTSCIETDET